MSHTGFVELGLLEAGGSPAVGPNTRVSIRDAVTGRRFGTLRLSFPPVRRIEVPAYPESQVLVFDVTPERYMARSTTGITVTNGETVARRLTVLRLPSRWQAAFASWALLPVQFDAFKRVLSLSPHIRLVGGAELGALTGTTYDQISVPKQVLAKAALLNLHLKLRKTADPTGSEACWFDYVEEILEINRERVIARASASLLSTVTKMCDEIDSYPMYKRAPAGEHFKNVPRGHIVTRSRIVSVKTDEDNGNLQITAAPATDSKGNKVVLVDADIDENGQLLAHLVDLFKHTFTGGTHPFVVYDYLSLVHENEPIGYELV